MLSTLKYLFFITIFSTNILANYDKKFSQVRSKFKSTFLERKLTKDFIIQLNDIRKNKLNSYKIEVLRRKMAKMNHLEEETDFLKKVRKISFQKKARSLLKNCAIHGVSSNPYLEKKIIDLCYVRIRDTLNNYTFFNKQRISEIYDFIDLFHQNLFKDKKNTFFKHYGKYIGKSTALREKIIPLLTNKIIANEYDLKKQVLSFIPPSPEITRYIQETYLKNSLKNIEKNYYLKYKGLLSKIDEDKDKKETQKAVEQFIEYYQNSSEHLKLEKANKRMLIITGALLRRKNFDLAKKILLAIAKGNPVSNKTISELHFAYTYIYFVESKFKEGYEYIKQNNLMQKSIGFNNSKLSFWISKVLDKNNKFKESIQILNQIIKKDPFSFYAIMANKKFQDYKQDPLLKKNHPKLINTNLQELIRSNPKFTYRNVNKYHERMLKKINIYSYLNHFPLLRSNLKKLLGDTDSINLRTELAYLSSFILRQNKKHIESFKVIYRGIDRGEILLNERILSFLFPKTDYMKFIKESGENKNVDPFLILSLIRQESGFNPSARSRVGALGLMQIMPATARTLSRKIKTRQLKNPKVNINLGTKYLKYLLQKYDNNIILALSAYNAGESRVEKWIEKFFKEDSILSNVEMIPFPETRKYVKLISRNLFFYKYLLESKKDGVEYNKIYDVELGFEH